MNLLNDSRPIATSDQFKKALLAIRDWSGISPGELQMLQSQCRAPDCTISASQIAEQLKFKDASYARLRYAKFARAVAERLDYVPPLRRAGSPCWWFTLSVGRDVDNGDDDDEGGWIMRPELVAALRSMKWA